MNKNKGFIGIGLILAIVLGVAIVGGGAYYLGKGSSKQEEVNKVNVLPDTNVVNNETQDHSTKQTEQPKSVVENPSEESSTESFKNQSGAIKSVKSNGTNKWILAVDLLSNNPDWIPGENHPYLNQSTKIRNLNVTNLTKTYHCNVVVGSAELLQNTVDYITDIQNYISRAKEDIKYRIGGPVEIMTDWVTYSFDITGTNITAIYEKCLP